ncbi:MAG TPA: exosortase/archaeosortase family protein [Opitutaceae bacterium]
MSSAASIPSLLSGRPTHELAALGAALVAIFVGSSYLLPFWQESPELSHAFFTPLLSLWLLAISRHEPSIFPASRGLRNVAAIALSVAFVTATAVASLAALSQGVRHTQTAFLAAGALTLFLLGVVLTLSRSTRPLVVINGASLCAAVLWIFAAPLSAGMLSRLTLFLQERVTIFALEVLRFLGVPAMRNGNVLILADQYVGVEEACSGIRSLIACLFAGVFMGGLLLRGVAPRILLVIAAAAIAIIANFGRAVGLCLLAANGTQIDGLWHDGSAYAVLGLTVLALFGLCTAFSPAEGTTPPVEPVPGDGAKSWLPVGLAAAAAVFVGFVLVRLQPAEIDTRPPPDLAAIMQIESNGWRRTSNDSIARFAEALNTQYLHQETYRRGQTQLTLYMAYWPARQATLGSVGVHTPDLCLPGAGWSPREIPPAIAGYPLPEPQRFQFVKDNYPQHVWFWHVYGGYVVENLPNLYPWNLGRYLLKRPVSSSASQWVLRISSNEPLESLSNEPILKEFFDRVTQAGLTVASVP